jgi:hypothetical protein
VPGSEIDGGRLALLDPCEPARREQVRICEPRDVSDATFKAWLRRTPSTDAFEQHAALPVAFLMVAGQFGAREVSAALLVTAILS